MLWLLLTLTVLVVVLQGLIWFCMVGILERLDKQTRPPVQKAQVVPIKPSNDDTAA